jgi:hypothetical protein
MVLGIGFSRDALHLTTQSNFGVTTATIKPTRTHSPKAKLLVSSKYISPEVVISVITDQQT